MTGQSRRGPPSSLSRPGFIFILALLFILPAALSAETTATNQVDQLAGMPIDDLEALMKIKVTLADREEKPLFESPAAISVLTQDDIRRSGATSIPEALRLVPGLDVAQVDSQRWAISARGFNDVFANKLLVMQDGRSLYTPLFSGVFWDVQNPPLDDIDRVEVIRGPGASMWGANAVNGVINIISKSAKDTQGVLATGGGGSIDEAFGTVRYGGKLADDVYYRIYGEYSDRGDSVTPNGDRAHDNSQIGQGGFRMDWDTQDRGGDLVTFQGDVYAGNMSEILGVFAPSQSPSLSRPMPDDERVGGGNLLGRWTHSFSDTSDLKLQVYYDRSDRNLMIFKEALNTCDLDLQHHFTLGARNDFVWGLGYRLNDDKLTGNNSSLTFNPERQDTQLFSAFAQDEITLVEKFLHLTLGTRIEHNSYTGFEIQPDGRLAWTPTDRQTVWAAVSRAVRRPSEAEETIRLNQTLAPGVAGTIYGNENFASEEVLAYQLGYRVQPAASLSVDLTPFYNVYHDLRSEEFGPSPTQPQTTPFVPLNPENKLHGDTYGLELAPTWQVTDWWRLRPSYSLLKMDLSKDANSTDTTSISTIKGESPQQQASLHSSMDLPQNVSFDWTVRYVDQLSAFNIRSYVAADVRLGWRPTRNLELAIIGQNLGSSRHAEFLPTFINSEPTEVRPGVLAKVTWHFH